MDPGDLTCTSGQGRSRPTPSNPLSSSGTLSLSTMNVDSSSSTTVAEKGDSGKTIWSLGKEFEIELGRGVSENDTLLARSDKNAVNFVFNYSKLWCKSCKDLVFSLEKRALAENECSRVIVKQFQALESSLASLNGAPIKKQTLIFTAMMIEHCKDIEMHNNKRCRELLEVLTRQRTLFEKTRKYLKDKWKADVKRMVDAENSLFKTKTAYYQRCQTGVKLREELSNAQNLLNELSATATTTSSSVLAVPLGSYNQNSSTGSLTSNTPGSSPNSAVSQTTMGGNNAYLSQEQIDTTVDTNSSSVTSSTTLNQITKQRAKVERLEKQLSDNDKKEIELMYAYREAVDIANHRLCELEKSKIEILCDIRLTIMKSDEVVKDSLAELLSHLYATRLVMLKQYETAAAAFQDYVPCSNYMALVESHVQKGTEFVPEKYHFDGFHESIMSGSINRNACRPMVSIKELSDNDALFHSDSDSDIEPSDAQLATTTRATSGGGSNVLSTLVEFGSNLFRPDSKKSLRGKRGPSSNIAQATNIQLGSLETIAAHEANLEKEYITACYPVARCIAAIEKQENGLSTHGIYRVPASKAKISALMELLQSNQPNTLAEIEKDINLLSNEHPLILASAMKTRLIALPEPLLTYSLYPNFVEIGKTFDMAENSASTDLLKRLQLLINHLSPGNRQLAGLVFHHLRRVSACQDTNQMGATNLGTMFAPTVLRQKPKFQVANMMEFMDNKGQTKVVELLIEYVVQIFGNAALYDPIKIIISLTEAINDVDNHPDNLTTVTGNASTTANFNYALDNILCSNLRRSASTIGGNSSRTILASTSGALPLYTPFRRNNVSKDTSKILSTDESNTLKTGTDAKPTSSKVQQQQQSSPYSYGVKYRDLSKNFETKANMNVGSISSSRSDQCITQTSTSTTSTTSIPSVTTKFTNLKLIPSSTKSGTITITPSSDTSTHPAISSLAVVLRKQLGKLPNQSTTITTHPVEPSNLDQYSFIDVDTPDSPST